MEVKASMNKGFWKPEEDLILKNYVETHGEGNWTLVSKKSGLNRGAKSCRLRWKNYLRPNIKRGIMSPDERDLIIRLHKLLGNRWSLIAGRLPGRTDNEVKNYWNTHLNKRPSRAQTQAPPPAPAVAPPPPRVEVEGPGNVGVNNNNATDPNWIENVDDDFMPILDDLLSFDFATTSSLDDEMIMHHQTIFDFCSFFN